ALRAAGGRTRDECGPALAADRARGRRGESSRRSPPTRTFAREARRRLLPGRGVRSVQALAGPAFRRARAQARRAGLRRLAVRLREGPCRRRGDRRRERRRRDQPVREDRSRERDRPAFARRSRGEQRFGPHARRRRRRAPGGGAVRLLQPRAHAAARAQPPHRQDRYRMQPVFRARMPARALQVHERARARTRDGRDRRGARRRYTSMKRSLSMDFRIDRRSALKAGAALAAAYALPAGAQAKPTLRFAAVFSDKDIRAGMIQMFAKEVEGDFKVEPFYNGTLFKQGTELVALQRDNLEMGNIAPQDVSKQIPAWSILTSAYLFRDDNHL